MKDYSLPNSNYWVCDDDVAFAEWAASVPLIHAKSDEPYLLTDEILELGKKYAVYDLVELTDSPSAFKKSGITYGQFMKGILENARRSSYIFPSTEHAEIRYTYATLAANSQLCYYDADGKLVEGIVSNMGRVLKDWMRDDKFKQQRADIYNPFRDMDLLNFEIQPFNIGGYITSVDEWSGKEPYKYKILFRIYTDVWFPWVRGYNCDLVSVYPTEMYDNRALANCHTPRLNAFLAETRAVIEAKGGTWQLGVGEETLQEPLYTCQISETGILLDGNV